MFLYKILQLQEVPFPSMDLVNSYFLDLKIYNKDLDCLNEL